MQLRARDANGYAGLRCRPAAPAASGAATATTAPAAQAAPANGTLKGKTLDILGGTFYVPANNTQTDELAKQVGAQPA